ncbi:MAG TPA: type II toxin-antitoxin system VapC family toxin [Caulobacteraceae bacterium]
MNLLLDTHLLLQAAVSPAGPVSRVAAELIGDPSNQLVFSAASIWEVAIKHGLGRRDFDVEPHGLRRALLENGYEELPVTGEHAAFVTSLPPIHKDPFDRLLVAQAALAGLILLTADAVVARYPGPIRAV